MSGNPENIGRQVQNMIGTCIKSEPETDKELISPETMLPDRKTFSITHDREKYFVGQIGIGRCGNNGIFSN